MLDSSYHPILRPTLFCLPGETARRAVIRLLSAQSRMPGGSALFRQLAQSHPPRSVSTRFLGLQFASPIGLGAGIDVDGQAALLFAELGLGFLELGPVGMSAQPHSAKTNPRRLRRTRALAMSGDRDGPAINQMLMQLPQPGIPVALHVRLKQASQTIEAATKQASFFILPADAAESKATLRELRTASKRPLLIRVLAGSKDSQIDRAIRNASSAGIDGALIVAGYPYRELKHGEVIWNGALPRALSIASQFVDTVPLALSGGVHSPVDAEAALDAGFGLISLSDGLVFAGPGLPKRINSRIVNRAQASPEPIEPVSESDGERLPNGAGNRRSDGRQPATGALPPSRLNTVGVALLLVFSAATTLLGAAYLVLAATVKLLPYDTDYLGISVSRLCAIDDCRLVDFLSHGRMSYGGTLVAIGVMTGWLTAGPLRRHEPWAWWTLLFGGVATYGSFLMFLTYGYFDSRHAIFVCLASAVGIGGLVLTRPYLNGQRNLAAAFHTPAADAWLWSPSGRGRLMIALLASGIAAGGVSILIIASSVVFVPQDTAFMGLNSQDLSNISKRLIPIMAHDRAGFGGGMLAIGILFAATAWCGLHPNAKGAWRALAISGLIFYTPTLAIHIAIKYTSPIHLFPVYAGLAFLIMALLTLWGPLHSGSHKSGQFADA